MGCQLWVSVISGLIAGGFAIAAVYWTLRGQRQRDKDRQQEIIQGVKHAMYEELKEIYNQLDSLAIENSWKEFDEKKYLYYNTICTFSEDYSIIFRSNANLIGQIESLDLRREIVRNYKALDILMQEYKKNNSLLNQRKIASKTGQQELASELYFELQIVASGLRELHNSSKKSIKKLLDMLKKELPELTNEDSTNI